MKIIQKILVYTILILTYTVLCYNVFYQSNNSSFSKEINTESNIATNNFSSDADTYDDDHILNKIKKFTIFIIEFQPTHFQYVCLYKYPSFTIWQPPKICWYFF